jgi:hypothetical protein
VPIALAEELVGEARTTPWLGRVGLAVAAVLAVLGTAVTTYGTYRDNSFIASVPQLVSIVVIMIALHVVAADEDVGNRMGASGSDLAVRAAAAHVIGIGQREQYGAPKPQRADAYLGQDLPPDVLIGDAVKGADPCEHHLH